MMIAPRNALGIYANEDWVAWCFHRPDKVVEVSRIQRRDIEENILPNYDFLLQGLIDFAFERAVAVFLMCDAVEVGGEIKALVRRFRLPFHELDPVSNVEADKNLTHDGMAKINDEHLSKSRVVSKALIAAVMGINQLKEGIEDEQLATT